MAQNYHIRPQALACAIICSVWLQTADVGVLAECSRRDCSVKSLRVCPLPTFWKTKWSFQESINYVNQISSCWLQSFPLHFTETGGMNLLRSLTPPRDGGYQRVQLTLWQIILKFGIVHSPGSYYEYWQSWKQSTNCQTMVAEVIAWVFNMITVLVLLTPCLALSNLSLVFDNWLCIWWGNDNGLLCRKKNFF